MQGVIYRTKNFLKKQNTKTITEEQMFSNFELKKLIIPLILEQFLEVTVGMMDTLMVSAVGEAAVSGVSLVDEVMVLMINIFAALGTGGAVIVGHLIGGKKLKSANKTAEQAAIFVTATAIFIMILLYLGKNFVLYYIFGRIEPAVTVNANIYYMIVNASVPFIALYNVAAAVFRVMGNSVISMKTSLLMNAINIGGNALLIYGFNMGVEGVAIPTLVSRVVAAVIITALLFHKKYLVHFQEKISFLPEWKTIKKIAYIGIPSGFENGIFQLGRILTFSIISGMGTSVIAANAVANKIVMFQIMAGAAVGLAMITVVSQCIGAEKYEQAKHYTKKLMKYTYMLCFITTILTFISLPLVVRMYHLSFQTSRLVIQLVLYHGICVMTIWPFAWVLPYTLRASGDVRYTMFTAISSMWIFRVGLGVILGVYSNLGVFGIWIAMTADWLFRGISFTIRYLNEKWIKQKINKNI